MCENVDTISNVLGRGASRKRSLPNNPSVEEQQELIGGASKYDEDEDDFNESSLIHVRLPGRKVLHIVENKNIQTWVP